MNYVFCLMVYEIKKCCFKNYYAFFYVLTTDYLFTELLCYVYLPSRYIILCGTYGIYIISFVELNRVYFYALHNI